MEGEGKGKGEPRQTAVKKKKGEEEIEGGEGLAGGFLSNFSRGGKEKRGCGVSPDKKE